MQKPFIPKPVLLCFIPIVFCFQQDGRLSIYEESKPGRLLYIRDEALPLSVPHTGGATALWPNNAGAPPTSYTFYFFSNNWLVRDSYDMTTGEHTTSSAVPMQQYKVESRGYHNLITQFTNAPCDFQAMTDTYWPGDYVFFKGTDMYRWTNTQNINDLTGTLSNLGQLCI